MVTDGVDRDRGGVPVRLGLALALALVVGCAAPPGAGPPAPAAPPGPGAPPAASPAPVGAPALGGAPTPAPVPGPSRARAAVAAGAAAAGSSDDVTLGIAVLDRATGAVESNEAGTRPLRAASVAKLITVADLLDGRASGRVPVTAADDDRIRRSLGPSDDAAMNALWSRGGGADGVRRVAGALGLTATAPPADPSQWGETTTSARDAAVLLAALAARPAADRDLVLGALATAPAVATDGFDQAFGLLDPATRGTAAAKQGWLCCLESSVDLHSAGLPDPGGRYVVALMSNQPLGYDAARDVLDEAAGALRATLDGA